jgi:hypothetical protein
MSHLYAMSLTKPHEALGLPQPLAFRLPQGLQAWNLFVFGLILALGAVYIVQVNLATSKGYALMSVEKKVEGLQTENLILQDKIATMSSIQSLNARATELGLAPAEKLEFVNPVVGAYAMR